MNTEELVYFQGPGFYGCRSEVGGNAWYRVAPDLSISELVHYGVARAARAEGLGLVRWIERAPAMTDLIGARA